MIFSFFHPTPCTPHLPQAKDGTAVLIWGGSTAVGFAAIQLAKAMGCKVYTTCSAKNVAQLEAAGADVVVDYRKEGALDELKAAAKDVRYAFDTVGEFGRPPCHPFLRRSLEPGERRLMHLPL